MKTSALLALLGALAISAIPASATPTFDFTTCTAAAGETSGLCSSGYSSTTPLSYTVNGVTVTAQAYVAAAGTGTLSGGNTNATVGQYTGAGLGVCSTGDTAVTGCSSPSHQIDNMNTSSGGTGNKFDFIAFTFTNSTTHALLPVTLTSIQLANYGSTGQNTGPIDMDLTYWINPTSFTTVPTGGTNVFCGDSAQGAANQNACPGSFGSAITDTIGATNVTTLLVAAYTGGTGSGAADTVADYFKIQGLTLGVTTQVGSAPEPATFGLIGLSLAGLGFARRKRKTN